MGKRNMFVPPGKLEARLLMNKQYQRFVVLSIHLGKTSQEFIVFRIKNP
jgi:hypothetical protein